MTHTTQSKADLAYAAAHNAGLFVVRDDTLTIKDTVYPGKWVEVEVDGIEILKIFKSI